MWLTISKLEFKKGFIHYFILYSFFLFWCLFTLFGAFFYSNVNKIINEYLKEIGISLFIYPKESQKPSEAQLTKLKELNYVKKVEFIPPKRYLEELQRETSFPMSLEEEILASLPALVKIWVKNPSQISQLQRELETWQQLFNSSIEIIGDNLSKTIIFWQYLNHILIIFLLLWNGFYFLFFYFLNKSLNNYLQNQMDTFQLLGGHVIKLKIIRSFLIVLPFILIYFFAFFIYYLVSKTLIIIFPIFEFLPKLSNSFDLFFFIFYFTFLILIYPLFTVFISYRKI